jgi:acetate kinase
MCALKKRRCDQHGVYHWMDGLMMERMRRARPDVVLYLMQTDLSSQKITNAERSAFWVCQASATTCDTRCRRFVLPKRDKRLTYSCFRAAGTCRLATIGGLDAVIFTAGIGEALVENAFAIG